MFLQLAHTKTDVFLLSKKLTLECYKLTMQLPADEKYAMVQQIRRAALSVHLNIAEGCSRRSITERKRYFEIARGSVIGVDTALGVSFDLGYASKEVLTEVGQLIINAFKQLSGLINKEMTA